MDPKRRRLVYVLGVSGSGARAQKQLRAVVQAAGGVSAAFFAEPTPGAFRPLAELVTSEYSLSTHTLPVTPSLEQPEQHSSSATGSAPSTSSSASPSKHAPGTGGASSSPALPLPGSPAHHQAHHPAHRPAHHHRGWLLYSRAKRAPSLGLMQYYRALMRGRHASASGPPPPQRSLPASRWVPFLAAYRDASRGGQYVSDDVVIVRNSHLPDSFFSSSAGASVLSSLDEDGGATFDPSDGSMVNLDAFNCNMQLGPDADDFTVLMRTRHDRDAEHLEQCLRADGPGSGGDRYLRGVARVEAQWRWLRAKTGRNMGWDRPGGGPEEGVAGAAEEAAPAEPKAEGSGKEGEERSEQRQEEEGPAAAVRGQAVSGDQAAGPQEQGLGAAAWAVVRLGPGQGLLLPRNGWKAQESDEGAGPHASDASTDVVPSGKLPRRTRSRGAWVATAQGGWARGVAASQQGSAGSAGQGSEEEEEEEEGGEEGGEDEGGEDATAAAAGPSGAGSEGAAAAAASNASDVEVAQLLLGRRPTAQDLAALRGMFAQVDGVVAAHRAAGGGAALPAPVLLLKQSLEALMGGGRMQGAASSGGAASGARGSGGEQRRTGARRAQRARLALPQGVQRLAGSGLFARKGENLQQEQQQQDMAAVVQECMRALRGSAARQRGVHGRDVLLVVGAEAAARGVAEEWDLRERALMVG